MKGFIVVLSTLNRAPGEYFIGSAGGPSQAALIDMWNRMFQDETTVHAFIPHDDVLKKSYEIHKSLKEYMIKKDKVEIDTKVDTKVDTDFDCADTNWYRVDIKKIISAISYHMQ